MKLKSLVPRVVKWALGYAVVWAPIAFAQTESSSESQSKMGIFVEPAITYEMGDTDTNYPSPFSNSSGDLDGFGLGARVGFHLGEIFFLGADGRYAWTKWEDSSGYDADATVFNWGPVVGIQTPIVGLRVWGGYIVDSQLDPDAEGSLDVKMEDGTGFRVGAGFRLAMVSLNLEYQDVKYDKAVLQKIGPFNPGTSFDSVEVKNKSWIASVSFPFEF